MGLRDELEAYLHAHIPISAAMGVTVLEADEDQVRLQFPLEPNLNHRQTAFGGSEQSAAILAAWSLLWVRMRDHELKPKLVIRASSMEYTRSIESDFVATTRPTASDDWDSFIRTLNRRHIGRIVVRADVRADGQVCGEFSGTFAAIAT